jgi:hypothetical protein
MIGWIAIGALAVSSIKSSIKATAAAASCVLSLLEYADEKNSKQNENKTTL